jgi:twitching motility protein PilT
MVLHVGERPIVVGPKGPVEVASAAMTLETLDGLLRDLLGPEAQKSLVDFGAVETDLPPLPSVRGERFTAVVARGGDDIWIEFRRAKTAMDSATNRATPAAPESSRPVVRPEISDRPSSPPSAAGEPAVVLPIARSPIRAEGALRSGAPRLAGLDRLLRMALARGAEALYLLSDARPAIRVDGEVSPIEGESQLTPHDIEAMLLDVAPDPSLTNDRLSHEWICDVADVGRVRCVAFHDQRGPGGIFRLMSARAVSAEQLGLSREIQSLASETDGLIVVTGPRASGKSTLLAAFVDLINRGRGDHVITIESRVKVVHENRSALVSQREVRGGADELVATLNGVLRESPDVIVIEDLRGEAVAAAIDAAASGYLVIAGVQARSTTEAVTRLVEQCSAERRAALQVTLAETLRGVVSQVLLRKTGGGRVAARELMLGTSAVSGLIAEGKLAQLSVALDSGRRHGMVPLTDALVAFVQSGAVDVREAWRRASDRSAFVDQLKRQGIDTSFIERLA